MQIVCLFLLRIGTNWSSFFVTETSQISQPSKGQPRGTFVRDFTCISEACLSIMEHRFAIANFSVVSQGGFTSCVWRNSQQNERRRWGKLKMFFFRWNVNFNQLHQFLIENFFSWVFNCCEIGNVATIICLKQQPIRSQSKTRKLRKARQSTGLPDVVSQLPLTGLKALNVAMHLNPSSFKIYTALITLELAVKAFLLV